MAMFNSYVKLPEGKSSVQNPEPSPTGWSIGVPWGSHSGWCKLMQYFIISNYQVVQPPIIIGSTRCFIKHPQWIYLRLNQFMLRPSLDFWFRPGGVLDRDMAPCFVQSMRRLSNLCLLIGGSLVVHCWLIGIDWWLISGSLLVDLYWLVVD